MLEWRSEETEERWLHKYSTHRGITPKAEGLILDVLYLGLHPSHGEGFQSKLRDKFGMANEFLGYKPLGDDIQTSLLTLA